MKGTFVNKLTALFFCSTFSLCLHAQISLGPNVSTFAVLASQTVTNSGPTVITGNLGVSPLTAITGFATVDGGPGLVVGTIYANTGLAPAAQAELTTSYNTAAGLPSNGLNPANLGGTTVFPGVYTSSSTLGITGTVTLDAQNNPNAIFVFQIGSGLTTATNSVVQLINQASPANVYWQVGSSATLGTTSSISGNILALTSISFGTGAVLRGRALARNGAVTLLGNIVNNTGAPVATPTPTPPPLPAPSSLILVATALVCAGIYQKRERLLKPFRRN